ncbi:MAG: aldose 1-epimerase family protein [Crocinitomicaceae bacterium]|nr:aldose 1-epimerase family protein [Crocinitomicaceae bacterium]MCF8410765.1 aldose 1-epimerase family protein [Crocinitomicaceae bacterium]MCF8443767.1 aldose 1-epimerase family protein [Crocinitomicaceae bacterium]
MIRISNGFIVADIIPKGAELITLKKVNSENVLWRKKDEIWNRVSPNLFPIVGRLKSDAFFLHGQQYQMMQHGFARDCHFDVLNQEEDRVQFILVNTIDTYLQYPFHFEFVVTYELRGFSIEVTYQTTNLDQKTLPYSVGGHPGFSITGNLNEYSLNFNQLLSLNRSILDGPYYSGKSETMSINKVLPLENSLFVNDALVFKNPPFSSVTLNHDIKGPIVTVSSENWEAIGFWTKIGAPFFCIEPWWGWADSIHSEGDLMEKAGMHLLEPNEMESVSFIIELH